MNTLSLVLDQVKQLLSLTGTDEDLKADKKDDEFGLFETEDTEDVPSGDSFGVSKTTDVSDEKVQEFIKKQEILELRQELVVNVKQLLAEGTISEEDANSIQELLKGAIDNNSTAELEEFAENIKDKVPTTETITDKTQIEGILDGLRSSTKESILEQLGGLDKIDSIVQYDNGNYKINTKDNKSVTAFPSGKFISSYDTDKRTGFDSFDENGKLSNSTYIDHQRNDAVVQETYDQHEDGGYTEKINDTVEPDIETTIEVSPENEVVSMQKENKKTGEVVSSFTAGVDNDKGSISSTEDIQGGLDSSNAELQQLEQEQQEAQTQLSSDQESYTATETEMDGAISQCDSEIESGQSDLDSANCDLTQAESDVCSAQSEVSKADSDYSKAGDDKDSAQSDLDAANNDVDTQQGVTDTAQTNNQKAIEEEQTASDDANTAADDLNTATDATNDASNTKAGTGADLEQGVQETKAAFNVKNQEQAKVNAAQSEYNSAQAAKSEDKSIWGKIKSWVSNAFNALKNAIAGLDKAEAELEKKQREEERLRAIDEKAADELQRREEEQDKAQQVSDAAEVVLARKTGEREVTDQEYADALLDLADTVVVRDNAADEYDSALEQFMETYNYKVDAEGNLTDAEGKKVEISQVVGQLEQFVQGAVANKETTQASYEGTLQATAQAIEGDEADVERLGSEIETLKQHIAEEEEKLAMQEQMLASLAADKGELNAEKDGAGVVDDFAALFGGSYSKDEDAFEAKQAALEKAILSGNDEDLLEAYKTMYGDNEVVVDAEGNIVDPAEIPADADMSQYSTVKISDLDAETAKTKMSQDAVANVEASQIIEGVQNGTFAVGGQVVTMDDLSNALKAQAAQMTADMESAEWDQGALSLGISGVNDFLGIGTSASEMRAQVEHYNSLVDKLSKTTDPKEYAAIFEELTGSDFSASSMVQLLAYNGMTNSNGSAATGGEAPEGTYSLDDYVDSVKSTVNEQAEGNPDALVMTGNSKASEVTADYLETQKNAKQGVVGVATGVIGAVAGTAAVAAAPFTGGASVALFGAGMAALAGGGAGLALNMADAVHFMDGNKNLDLDFEYSFEEGVKDFALGALNGAVGQISAGAGSAVSGAITKAVVKEGVTTTATQAFGRAAATVAGNAVEGFVDGGISAGGEYLINAAADENVDFNAGEFFEAVAQGGSMGAVFNVGANGLIDAGKTVANHGNVTNFMSDVNKALTDGTSGNAVADMIAGKLDGDLLVDGKVNKWAASQLMANADNSLAVLAKAGITDDAAMDILNKTSLKAQQNLPGTITTITNALQGSNADEFQALIKGLDTNSIVTDNAGNVLRAQSVMPDGTEVVLDFGAKGKLEGISFKGATADVNLDDLSSKFKVGDDVKINTGAKVDGDGTDTPKVDGGDVDAPKVDGGDVDTPKVDGSDVDVDTKAKVDGENVDVDTKAKVDGEDVNTPKVDGEDVDVDTKTKTDGSDVDTTKVDGDDAGAPKVDGGDVDTPKVDGEDVDVDNKTKVDGEDINADPKQKMRKDLQDMGVDEQVIEIMEQSGYTDVQYANFALLKKAGAEDLEALNLINKYNAGGMPNVAKLCEGGLGYNDMASIEKMLQKSVADLGDAEVEAISKNFTKFKSAGTTDADALNFIYRYDTATLPKAFKLCENGLSFREITTAENLLQKGLGDLSDAQFDALSRADRGTMVELYNYLNPDIKARTPLIDARNYDTLNTIINGELLDTNLAARLNDIGDMYGVKFKFDNDIISSSYRGSAATSKIISDDYLQAIEDTLADMKKSGVSMPKDIIISDFNPDYHSLRGGKGAGYFSPSGNSTIYVGYDATTDFVPAVIHHESSHMRDFNAGANGRFLSEQRAVDVYKYVSDGRQNLAKMSFNIDGVTVTGKDITRFVRDYATSNIEEFVAEVGGLVSSGSIVKRGNNWTFVRTAVSSNNYGSAFRRGHISPRDQQTFNAMMKMFLNLTQ